MLLVVESVPAHFDATTTLFKTVVTSEICEFKAVIEFAFDDQHDCG
jgi:hypothetical protein